jgi:hypothetical protein
VTGQFNKVKNRKSGMQMTRLRVVATALIITAALAGGCLGEILPLHKGIEYPRIIPNASAGAIQTPVYSFPFESSTVTLSAPVDAPVYYGAKTADKDIIIHGNVSEKVWVTQSYIAMINDPA